MAEVKIQLTGEDNATPVIKAVFEKTTGAFGDLSAFVLSETRAIRAGWQGSAMLVVTAIGSVATVVQAVNGALDELYESVKSIERRISKGIEFKIDTGAAMDAIRGIAVKVVNLVTPKVLTLDVSGALAGVWRLKAAIDSIPDVTTKTVIIRYRTQASPVMPFTEGIRYIRQKMESLPRGGDFIMRSKGVGMLSEYQTRTAVHAPNQQITLSPTIYVNRGGERDCVDIARELDIELARRWRYKRSELRKALTS